MVSTASNLADYVITEAGFGADAGAFKFMDILSRDNKINLACIVLVTTIRALKYNGDGDIEKGIENLRVHVENLRLMHKNIVVTLNRFEDDTHEDILFVKDYCASLNVPFTVNTVFQDGGVGALDLANEVIKYTEPTKVQYLYNLDDSLYNKIDNYVKKICHANGFTCSIDLMRKINELDKYKYPICVAKTQYSISDDKKKLGFPQNYTMQLTNVEVKNGSKLIIVYFGKVITMPGLNDHPAAKDIKYIDGEIILPR